MIIYGKKRKHESFLTDFRDLVQITSNFELKLTTDSGIQIKIVFVMHRTF